MLAVECSNINVLNLIVQNENVVHTALFDVCQML